MPSGSHGGSSGSHSSGGSSFGGGGSSSSGSSYGGSRSSRPHFRWHGHVYYYSAGASFLVVFINAILMFALITTIAGFFIIPQEKKDVKKIEEDYYYYQSIIDMGYFTTAKVDDIFCHKGYDKYYITYTIDIPSTLKDLEGYSYSVYTREQAFALLQQGTITVALNRPVANITENTDSIPIDYKNMPMENDYEYVMALKGVNNARWCAYGGLGVMLTGFAIILFINFKTKAKQQGQLVNSSYSSPTGRTQYCAYCGTETDCSKTRCPSCGNRFKK